LSRSGLARAAFEALRQQIEEPASPKLQREFMVSTRLVTRGSTAPPAAAGW
jgi:DNA-binding LacI/PurR family transcriptional regulator